MKYILRIAFLLLLSVSSYSLKAQTTLMGDLSEHIDIIVAQDGSGDYETVTEALNHVPSNSSERTVMYIKNGTYEEKVYIPSSKVNLTIIGEDVDSTILTYNDYSGKTPNLNTFNSESFRVDAENFRAFNMSIRNDGYTNPNTSVSQAPALITDGDKQIFAHCKLWGFQDTYYSRSSDNRAYFKDCLINGTVDFIFGESVVVFDSCQIHNLRLAGGYMTAASTESKAKFGYVFTHCRITASPGTRDIKLGRPWKNYPKTVFMYCDEGDFIASQGWNTWGGTEENAFYAEYKNTGAGYSPETRASWAHILSDEQASEYTFENIYSKNTNSSFTENWIPDLSNDSIYRSVNDYTIPYMDSINYNAGITQIRYASGEVLNLTEGINTYNIELDPSTTEVPEFEVFTENPRATVEIEYPESLPGVTTILVTAYDRSTYSEVTVYNSINGAYNNAYLDSLYLKNIKVENFDPEVFEYDFVLPPGSSKYFAIKPFKQVEDASYRIDKPSSLPGLLTITVTSFSGEIVNVYKINVSVSTGINEIMNALNLNVYYNESGLNVTTEDNTRDQYIIEIYDVNGKKVVSKKAALNSEETYVLPYNFDKGIYFYKVTSDNKIANGKFVADW